MRLLISCLTCISSLSLHAQYPSQVLMRGDGWKIIQTPRYDPSPARVPRFEDYYRPRSNNTYVAPRREASSRNSPPKEATPESSGGKVVPAMEPWELYIAPYRDQAYKKDFSGCIEALERSRYWERSFISQLGDEDREHFLWLHLRCFYEQNKYLEMAALLDKNADLKRIMLSVPLTEDRAGYLLGLAYLKTGRKAEVLELWLSFSNIASHVLNGKAERGILPGNRAILRQMGLIAYEIDEYRQAASYWSPLYDEEQALAPSNEREQVLYAHAQIESFNAAAGLRFLEKHSWSGFESDEKFEILSKGLLYAGRIDECRKLCSTALSDGRTGWLARLRLADCALYRQQWAEAERIAEARLAEDANDLYARYRYVFAQVMLSKPVSIDALDAAMAAAQKAGKLMGKSRNICESVKVLYYVRKNDLPSARTIVQGRIQRGSGEIFRDPLEFYALTQLLERDGRGDMAVTFRNWAVSAHFGAAEAQAGSEVAGLQKETASISLTEAVRKGNHEAMKKLIALGEAKTNGFPALLAACQMGDQTAVELLLKGGADPSETDANGFPVFFYLSVSYFLEHDGVCHSGIFQLLKEAGLRISPQMGNRYLMMIREGLTDQIGGKTRHKNKACRQCDEAITKILESCYNR